VTYPERPYRPNTEVATAAMGGNYDPGDTSSEDERRTRNRAEQGLSMSMNNMTIDDRQASQTGYNNGQYSVTFPSDRGFAARDYADAGRIHSNPQPLAVHEGLHPSTDGRAQHGFPYGAQQVPASGSQAQKDTSSERQMMYFDGKLEELRNTVNADSKLNSVFKDWANQRIDYAQGNPLAEYMPTIGEMKEQVKLAGGGKTKTYDKLRELNTKANKSFDSGREHGQRSRTEQAIAGTGKKKRRG
jgi:hypothetical protein